MKKEEAHHPMYLMCILCLLWPSRFGEMPAFPAAKLARVWIHFPRSYGLGHILNPW
jgi:hypothetical protein